MGTYQNLFSYFLYNNFYIIKFVISKYYSKMGQRHLEDQQYEKKVSKMHPPAKKLVDVLTDNSGERPEIITSH